MVGIKDTCKVGDKIIRWESVIKWMLDWAQKQPHEKKEARDSFVKSEKIIFKDIKIGARKQNKELYAKLYHVASNCGLEEECAFYKKSGKVLAERIKDAKQGGRIGAYINKYYQEDSDEWKNAYAVFDSKATEQKEKLKKSRSTDEVVKSLVDVKTGKDIARQEYDKILRGAKQKQGCVLGDDCKCKGLVNEIMVGAPDRVGSFIHKKCLDRTCDACKEKGTAQEICLKSPTTPGKFVHRKCLERTCDACEEKGTAREICMESPTTPGKFVHPQCLERTCDACKEKGTALEICMESPTTPGEFVHKKCLERTCDACKEKGTAKEICMKSPTTPGENVHPRCLERTCDACKEKGTALEICLKSPTTPGEFVHGKCLERTCDVCKEKGTALEICLKSPTTPGEFVHQKCLERTCSFCGEKADARTIFKNLRCSTPGNPMFACRNEACRFQFPFKDPNGCAFCKRKFTCSVKSLDDMEKIWDRHKMKIEPKPKRDACRGCFERRFDLDQLAKREEKLEKILKKDKSELYEKLRKLLPKMKEIINKK